MHVTSFPLGHNVPQHTETNSTKNKEFLKSSCTAEIPAHPEVLLHDIQINILLASICITDRFPTNKDLSDTDFNRLSTSTESDSTLSWTPH